MKHFEDVCALYLGPEPRNWLKKLDYRLTKFLVRKVWAGSPRFVLFRCVGCHKLMSGKKQCGCGTNRFSPAHGSTWKVFWVWLRRR